MDTVKEILQWKGAPIPWKNIYNMSVLTLLVYDYVKYWKLDTFNNFNKFIESNGDNDKLSPNDINILKDIKSRAPDGTVIKFITNKAGLQCAIGKNPNENRYSIVFRGTESKWDMIHDMLITKTKIKDDVYVHTGFYRQLNYKNSLQELEETVGNCIEENPSWEWYITGHSLGAGQATIAGYLLSQQFKNNKWTVVSLASPRAGNKAFKESFNKIPNLRLYRVTNHRDLITSVPYFNYYHVGRTLHYDKDKKLWHDYGFEPKISYVFYRCWNFYDHPCSNYIKHLKQMIE